MAIINFTVWAIASAYMVHEKSRVEIERLHARAAIPLRIQEQLEETAEVSGRRGSVAYQLVSPAPED